MTQTQPQGPSQNQTHPYGSEPAKGPLAGIRVCDFSWVGAGPRATKELADHGAEVIKIESRARLDPSRRSPPFVNGNSPDHSAFFVMSNTSKKSVSLNLSTPGGVDLARQIAMKSDMVVENFGAGFLDRLGLGWSDLSAQKPDLVMVSVSIAGRTGPLATYRGFGNSAAATSGQAYVTGFPGQPPHLTNYAFGDVATPLFGAIAMMSALEFRRRTGKGIYVDCCQLESMMQLLSPALLSEAAGHPQTAIGNRATQAAPNGVFACARPANTPPTSPTQSADEQGNPRNVTDDDWVAISILNDAQWAAFVALSGVPDDPDLATTAGRLAQVDRVESIVSAWTRTHSKHHVTQVLLASDIAAAPVQNGQEVSEDSQLNHRHIADRIDHPAMGPVRHVAPAFKLSRTPAQVGPAPLIGQHNDDILRGLLGLNDAEIAELEAKGVLQ